jgi:hypothetical protein
METRDAAKKLADMSSSAISARLEQVSQLFEVSVMLKSAKKVASPANMNGVLADPPNEICSGPAHKVLQDNHKP